MYEETLTNKKGITNLQHIPEKEQMVSVLLLIIS